MFKCVFVYFSAFYLNERPQHLLCSGFKWEDGKWEALHSSCLQSVLLAGSVGGELDCLASTVEPPASMKEFQGV